MHSFHREQERPSRHDAIDGGYDISGATLVLHGYGMTEIGCDPARHAQDEWLIDFLRARPKLELSEPRLAMSIPGTRLILIDREVAIPDRPLVGTSWIGEALGAQPGSQLISDRVLLVLDGAPVTFAIDELNLELSQGTNSLYFRATE